MEPTKDANGVAWCTGSGYAIRRSALEDIGGWPVGSLAEDTFTSSLLLGSGWKTAFCHEALQYGTVPDTFTGHLKQRTRWTLGTLQTALKLKFCLFGKLVRGMSFFARLSAFVFAIDAFFKIFLLQQRSAEMANPSLLCQSHAHSLQRMDHLSPIRIPTCAA
jgi:cellulose synthase/poly-beta-1,6-N-acetylglucosamine synthase-like glycosyltransferase